MHDIFDYVQKKKKKKNPKQKHFGPKDREIKHEDHDV